ncbi:uncharacterized protein B0P05DRAFT_535045 [Gilbertella persicaria]|uniref:uncharacterized protein n=1 Tax=Gilbertella persicaria TaxID=101096 RepID=UPI002220968D|nr:uncharacterized protein B0P05DRAFT_535045 [Gilbertella persicaria]KAI8084307.1 hypothetical protein B0P05DRAFT_535045 [Gilbertella persicaria]
MSLSRKPLQSKNTNQNQITPPPKLDNDALKKIQQLQPFGLVLSSRIRKPKKQESQKPKTKEIKKRSLERLGSKKSNTPKRQSFKDEYDVPINRLPTDCLISIFQHCQDFETYCALLSVCHTWRSIGTQPFMWRKTAISWKTMYRQVNILHLPRRRFDQMHYIRSLTITDHNKDIQYPIIDIKLSPFRALRELYLINMSLADIDCLISWLRHIKKLCCQHTYIGQRPNLRLTMFSQLHQLEYLQIDFAEHCNLGLSRSTFLSDSQGDKKEQLPSTLKTLSLWGVYDYEEVLFEPQVNHQEEQNTIAYWLQVENTLVQKYHVFASLSNLTSLSLGYVSSFTSRVWRECMLPCANTLLYLDMHQWDSKRESPEMSLRRRLTEENVKDDAEEALAEFIGALNHIKEIQLDAFVCSQGLVDGLAALDKKYEILHGLDKEDDLKIESFMNKQLIQFKIKILNA